MGQNSKIEWCDHTLNWWIGCEAISPACAHCYAAAWAKRVGRNFAVRTATTAGTRNEVLKYEREAGAFAREHGRRQRIFVNSLSDWADNQVPQTWRDELFEMIKRTPSLDYLLLTKRIGNVKRMLPPDWGVGYPNVWLGSTVINQEEADRDIPKLISTPARVRFLSCEPLLGPINIAKACVRPAHVDLGPAMQEMWDENTLPSVFGIDWVIVGGESGGQARPMNPTWVHNLLRQCIDARVPFLFKQWGEWADADYSVGGDWRATIWANGGISVRVGKKNAGRAIAGREYTEFPRVAA